MRKLKELTVIGLNSGTSMDGVDAAAFRIKPAPGASFTTARQVPELVTEMIGSILYEFEPAFGLQLRKLVASENSTLDEICRLDAALGQVFGRAARALMRSLKLSYDSVDLIGSHGQTIWHAPQAKLLWGESTRNSMQLGQPAVIAEATGVPVIADFRVADMAAGGQGAPLTPFADEVLFGHLGHPVGVLNLGGIANITILNGEGCAVAAYDSGPGNMLIDRAANRLFNLSYDRNGEIAASGSIDQDWLRQLKCEKYYALPPPKTTGRELFGLNYADRLCHDGQSKGLSPADIVATLTALTAVTVAETYARFVNPANPIEELIIGGGGSHNKHLCQLLVKFWPHKLKPLSHEDLGLSSKFKESLLFALLAYTSYFQIPNNVPACTGATKRVCLGKWSPPSVEI